MRSGFSFDVDSLQALQSAFEAELPSMQAYANRFFWKRSAKERLILDVIEAAWYNVRTRFERGVRPVVSLRLLCCAVLMGYRRGDDGTSTITHPGGRPQLIGRGYNDSRAAHATAAKEEALALKLDFREALRCLPNTYRRILRLMVAGMSRVDIMQRLRISQHQYCAARAALAAQMADYA